MEEKSTKLRPTIYGERQTLADSHPIDGGAQFCAFFFHIFDVLFGCLMIND